MPLGVTRVFLWNCEALGLPDPKGLMATSHKRNRLVLLFLAPNCLCYNSWAVAAIRFTLHCKNLMR